MHARWLQACRAAPLLAAAILASCTGVSLPPMGEGPPRISTAGSLAMGVAPVKGADAKFMFAPTTGVPANLKRALIRGLEREAETRRITIVEEGDPAATYRVKGYMSAIGDMAGTNLVFVYDVNDMTGQRLHRISGQEPGNPAVDPWAGINEEAVAAAARRVIDALAAWSKAP